MLRRLFNKFAFGLPFAGFGLNIRPSSQSGLVREEQKIIKFLRKYTSRGLYPVFTGGDTFSYETNGVLQEFLYTFQRNINPDLINEYFGYPVFETFKVLSMVDGTEFCSGDCIWQRVESNGVISWQQDGDGDCSYEGTICECKPPDVDAATWPFNSIVVPCGKNIPNSGCGKGCVWVVSWINPNDHFLGKTWKLSLNRCIQTCNGCSKKPNIWVDGLAIGVTAVVYCQPTQANPGVS